MSRKGVRKGTALCSRCQKPWHGPQCTEPLAVKMARNRAGLTQAEIVAMALCYGVVVIADDEPGLTPAQAWEREKATHEFYRFEAARFLGALKKGPSDAEE